MAQPIVAAEELPYSLIARSREVSFVLDVCVKMS
jgi:hypothetical protein